MTEIHDDLWLYTPNGALVMPDLPLTSLEWTLEENKFGVLRASGPLNEIDTSLFQLDSRFEVHRFANGQPLGVEGNTQFFLRYWSFGESENGQTWEIEAYTPEYWLTGLLDLSPWEGATAKRTEHADDMIKTVVTDVLAAVNYSYWGHPYAELEIEPDLSLAPSVTKASQLENVSILLQAIADDSYGNGTWLTYGMVKKDDSGSGFVFKTWINQRGQDHSLDSADEVIVSKANGNLNNPRIGFDHRQEWNSVYALGKGSGLTRAYAAVEDLARIKATRTNYRRVKIESNQTDDNTALAGLASSELRKGKPKIGFSGSFIDTDYARYGLRVQWGDLVTAEYLGYSFTCHLNRVQGKYSRDGGEVLDIGLSGEL